MSLTDNSFIFVWLTHRRGFVLVLLSLISLCFSQSTDGEERARLPEFLTELDLASLEASEEDIEALKTVVKRLAPEKNGEYQVYQGFNATHD